MQNDSSSSVNTVLIVLVLIILVACGVWYFTMYNKTANTQPEKGLNIDIKS